MFHGVTTTQQHDELYPYLGYLNPFYTTIKDNYFPKVYYISVLHQFHQKCRQTNN